MGRTYLVGGGIISESSLIRGVSCLSVEVKPKKLAGSVRDS
jgi:hypothetical protein